LKLNFYNYQGYDISTLTPKGTYWSTKWCF